MVESSPAIAGNMDSIPALGRSHMPVSNWARVPRLLSLCSGAQELQVLRPACLDPVLRNRRSHCNEEPVLEKACAQQ